MSKITVELVRKRSEHNEGEISTLEEISLHQEDIVKMENLDKWCKHLKILYLQSNLIAKIENVSRMKKLEYLNLALNNIERIENLEGCESLQKLDLTVNFIGELTSVESLKNNIHLESLFLTGNPCADFRGYREYVITVLPQLVQLDGTEIERSERIKALQVFDGLKKDILDQQKQYQVKRQQQKERAEREKKSCNYKDDEVGLSEEEKEKGFWSQVSEHCPETRVEIATHIKNEEEKRTKAKEHDPLKPPKREPKLFSEDGKPRNVNEAKINFKMTENYENNSIVLDVAVYKYLDSSYLDVDMHPNYVKILIKNKVFQIVLPEEIKPDISKAQRSQTTGHLVLTMFKANDELKTRQRLTKHTQIEQKDSTTFSHHASDLGRREYLEIGRSDDMDFTNIVDRDKQKICKNSKNSEVSDFVDNPEVPPLE